MVEVEADRKQSNLLDSVLEFNNKARARSKVDKQKQNSTYESVHGLYES